MSTVSSEYDKGFWRLDPEKQNQFLDLNEDQVARAAGSLTLDTSTIRRFRFRPNALHQIARFMVPGQLWVVAAATAIGKTTWGLSTTDDLLIDGARVAYLGLESEDFELRRNFACLRARVPVAVATENSWDEQPSGADMYARVQHQLDAQMVSPLLETLLLLPQREINAKVLLEAAAQAKDFGADVLVVDHANHGEYDYTSFSKLIRLSKAVAERNDLVNITLAQMSRAATHGGHRLTRYQPMQMQHIQGGGVIEQNAVVVLNLYRPIVTGTDETTKRLVKQAMKGDIEAKYVLQPNRMGITVLKHRVRGELESERCVLKLEHGKLTDL